MDPLAGSYFVESTTNEMEKRIVALLERLDAEGGIVQAVSEGRVLGLYDLAADPGEKRDLSADSARVSALRAKLAAFTGRLHFLPRPQP